MQPYDDSLVLDRLLGQMDLAFTNITGQTISFIDHWGRWHGPLRLERFTDFCRCVMDSPEGAARCRACNHTMGLRSGGGGAVECCHMGVSVISMPVPVAESELRTRMEYAEQMEKKLELERKMRSMEFKFLQSQISPHFLFNTLNLLMRTAYRENAPQTAGLICDLSELLRRAYRSKDSVCTLAEELLCAEKYLTLQCQRMGPEFSYSISCQPGGERIMILTAYNEFDFASKAMSMGIQDYLLKPMRPDLLLQRIRGVLDRPAAGPARTPQLWPCLACGMTHGLPEPLPMLPAQVMVALLSAPLTPEEEEQLSRQGGQALQGGGRLECHERQVVCCCRPEEGESPEDAAAQLCSQLLKSCQGDAAILERWLDLYCGALSRVCGEAGQDWMPHLSLDACFTPQALAQRTIAIIHSRYQEPLKLERVAREQFVSPAYLGRIFHTCTGQTFRDYLTQVRMQYADRLLREGHPVSSVAAAVGYEDPNYFSRVYKKQFGYPPKDGRR